MVVGLMLCGSIGSLKSTATTLLSGTPVWPFRKLVETTCGEMMSAPAPVVKWVVTGDTALPAQSSTPATTMLMTVAPGIASSGVIVASVFVLLKLMLPGTMIMAPLLTRIVEPSTVSGLIG